jgi:hypothetical protein
MLSCANDANEEQFPSSQIQQPIVSGTIFVNLLILVMLIMKGKH